MTNAVKRCGKWAVAFGVLVAIGAAVSMNARAASVTPPTVTAPTVTTPTVKTPTVPTVGGTTCASQMKVVKNAWKKAPAGPGKDTAKTHYDNAAAASKNNDDKTCLSELDAASAALK